MTLANERLCCQPQLAKLGVLCVARPLDRLYIFGSDPDFSRHFAPKAQYEIPNTSPISNDATSPTFPGTRMSADLGYSHYYGNLHSHSSYSDGVQTPADAYPFARLSAPTPLDFLAVTDHNNSGAGMQLSSYVLGQAQANAVNSGGDFVAIWGQEWGTSPAAATPTSSSRRRSSARSRAIMTSSSPRATTRASTPPMEFPAFGGQFG